jgi:hypothetical protein
MWYNGWIHNMDETKINTFMKHWLRILGSLLIASGIVTLILGVIVGIGVWLWSLIQAQDYTMAVGSLGTILIVGGVLIRQFVKEKTS